MMRAAWALLLVPLMAAEPKADVSASFGYPLTPPSRKKVSALSSKIIPKKAENFLINEDAVLYSLLWLARHQGKDGSWSVTGFSNLCEGEAKCMPHPGSDELDIGATGLALLAFLGAGYTHLSKDTYRGVCYGTVIKQAMQNLMTRQNRDGSFGDASATRFMLNSILAADALALEYALTASALVKDAAQKAVTFLLRSRISGSGWGYAPGQGNADVITTGWAILALGNAWDGELDLGADRIAMLDDVERFVDRLTDPKTSRVGYRERGRDGAAIPDRNSRFTPLPTATAAALATKFLIRRRPQDLERYADVIAAAAPGEDPRDQDLHHWFWANFALFAFDGPTGAVWKKWSARIKTPVLGAFMKKKELYSFWSVEAADKWSCEAGRVYSTAMAVLALEIYYRYAMAFPKDGKPLR